MISNIDLDEYYHSIHRDRAILFISYQFDLITYRQYCDIWFSRYDHQHWLRYLQYIWNRRCILLCSIHNISKFLLQPNNTEWLMLNNKSLDKINHNYELLLPYRMLSGEIRPASSSINDLIPILNRKISAKKFSGDASIIELIQKGNPRW